MPRPISRDTRLCMSLSGRPGNFGTRFHNYLYEALDLDFVYKAFTTTDLPAAIGGIRALGIRGCAVSMPFKEACIPLLDELDTSASAIDSVNTIVADDGRLRGYNTDYSAVASLLASHAVPRDIRFVVRGSGGMAKAVASAFRDSGYRHGTIVARNPQTGPALARGCGYAWLAELGDEEPQMLVNVTPLGMEGGPDADALAFTREQVAATDWVFDVVALPVETPLILLARELGKPVITGAEVIVLQAVEQFVLYTGVRPEAELIEKAAEFARG
ncbi:shikimate 5-dehydrogenase [Metapseudomonas lalkuanensis]|uniref:Shikimate 5-dehydrogenase n=1 Tax=Metapseudomonas lalkuanensis TaxID=2604832 RepID=A0A5J6QG97_9GAMM|nr:shikimate 5-dehydrogenase [Pseudomonas lalkuanensis]QEY61748.1 shikimate 5-dehydrogenase [Pseudomonas lalkuanensis]